MSEADPRSKVELAPEPQIYGLYLFVTDEEDNVLVFKNNQTKESTQKVIGQLTTPAETIEPGEKLMRDSLPRAIAEEVGYIAGANPKFRGTAIMHTPRADIHIVCMEIKTKRDSVYIDPKDSGELSAPRWVPLDEIDNRTFRIQNWDIPVYRSPIVELAENLKRAKRGEKFPIAQSVKPEMPSDLYSFLKDNPRAVYPVE
ncbi:MAG TPA: NUDIX hydrolase [Patescibacteria group bacterium]|nr:NUDIX hydrolase [Patescibacteria group bacterium]